MKVSKLVFFIAVLSLCGNTNFGWAQYPQIVNPVSEPVYYCNNPVVLAGEIIIQNLNITKKEDGLKISIVNYKKDEDILIWDAVNGFSYEWKENLGYLEIKGEGNSTEYQEAIRNVYYKNSARVPNQEQRSFAITLLDADYLPYTDHFYRYVNQTSVSWDQAEALASQMEYYGLKGYLATITSRVENDFIWAKIAGIGWVGASDASVEGEWKWVTGPEKGTLFWRGGINGTRVNGEYSNWGSGEPNNLGGGEDYAHLGHPNLEPKSWNDQSNRESNPNSIYAAKGFVVEFGGMEDADLKLSATALIQWSKLPELDLSDGDTLVCGSLTHKLQLSFFDEGVATVNIRPLQTNARVTNETTLAPTIMVDNFGVYSFEIELGNENKCSSLDTLTLAFQHKPDVDFILDEEMCYGYNVDLEFSGTTIEPANFTWLANDSIFTNGQDLTKITIPLGYGEKNRTVGVIVDEQGCVDSLIVPVKSSPQINFWVEENFKGCSPLQVKFGNSELEDIQSYTWEFGDGGSFEGENPIYSYTNNGATNLSFDVRLTVQSNNGCENTGVLIDTVTVYPKPIARFNANPSEALITNPIVQFTNSSENSSVYSWDFGDSSAIVEEYNPEHRYSEMGYYNVELIAYGNYDCVDTTSQQITVTLDKVFPPTAFSPNAFLKEDREFRIYANGIAREGYNLQVFNRWGEVVFESLSQEVGWNGTMRNDNYAPAGVYTWVVQFLDFRGEKYQQQGTVTLLF